jgi:hypothetical protein
MAIILEHCAGYMIAAVSFASCDNNGNKEKENKGSTSSPALDVLIGAIELSREMQEKQGNQN